MTAEIFIKTLDEIEASCGSIHNCRMARIDHPKTCMVYDTYDKGRVEITIQGNDVEVEVKAEGDSHGSHLYKNNYHLGDPELVSKVSEVIDKACLEGVLLQIDKSVDDAREIFSTLSGRDTRYDKISKMFDDLQKELTKIPVPKKAKK